MSAAEASSGDSSSITPRGRVPASTKIVYGLGQAAEGLKNTAFGLFLLFYYNQVLGLPGTLAGLALGIVARVRRILRSAGRFDLRQLPLEVRPPSSVHVRRDPSDGDRLLSAVLAAGARRLGAVRLAVHVRNADARRHGAVSRAAHRARCRAVGRFRRAHVDRRRAAIPRDVRRTARDRHRLRRVLQDHRRVRAGAVQRGGVFAVCADARHSDGGGDVRVRVGHARPDRPAAAIGSSGSG